MSHKLKKKTPVELIPSNDLMIFIFILQRNTEREADN